jgi:hypothetical protein
MTTDYKHIEPCPWCGMTDDDDSAGIAQAGDAFPPEPEVCYVQCMGCFARGPQKPTSPEALRAWNDFAQEVQRFRTAAMVLDMTAQLRKARSSLSRLTKNLGSLEKSKRR